MILQTFKVGSMECNCSIVVCPTTSEAVVVDPGGNAEEIIDRIKSLNAKVKLILITHAHFDHVAAAAKLRQFTGAQICLHRKDMWLYRLMPIQFRMARIKDKAPRINRLLDDGDAFQVGSISLSVLHTPGHSPGSCCFHCADNKVLFSGDTLFRGSIGNWRFPGGSLETLFRSINNKLLPLPDETHVIPGHGDETTIGTERSNNPYLKEGRAAELLLEDRERPGQLKMLWLLIRNLFV